MPNIDILKATKEALDKAIAEKKISQEMVRNLSPAILDTLTPILQEIAHNSKITKDEILEVISKIQVNVPEIKVPEANVKVEMPKINVPEANVRVNVDEVKVPEVNTLGIEKTLREVMSKFKLPKPEVTVNVPPIKMGKMEWPEGNMPIEGLVTLKGIDRRNPLPVELRDAEGNPMVWPTRIDGGSGGARVVTIGGIKDSAWGSILTPDGRLRTDGGSGAAGGGLTDAELRASHIDVVQMSGSIDSVNIMQTLGNPTVVGTGYQDNALRVVHATDAIVSVRVDSSSASVAANIVDSGGVPYTTTNPLPIGDAGGSLTVDAVNLDIRDLTSVDVVTVADVTASVKAALIDSSGVQYSGSNPLPITWISGAGATVAAANIDSSGVQYSGSNPIPTYNAGIATATQSFNMVDSGGVAYSGSNPVPISDAGGSVTIDGTVAVSGITNSVAAAIIDSGGVQYSTSNPLPIGDAGGSITVDGSVSVSGSITSTVVVGPTAADTADDGNPPVQQGGIARTANPTAVAANDVVKATFDDLGRQVIRSVQVRDLIQTARATATNVTETTLLAGSASTFHDLIYIMASNNSSGATAIDIRSGTANGIVLTIDLPANGVAGVSLPVPIPQDVAANAWTFQQQGDVSTTTVAVSALFSKEV